MIPKKGIIILTSIFVLIVLTIIIAGGIKHDKDSKTTSQEVAEILTRYAMNQDATSNGKDAHGIIAVAPSGDKIMVARHMYAALMEDKKIWLDHAHDLLLSAPMAAPAPLLLIFFAFRRQS